MILKASILTFDFEERNKMGKIIFTIFILAALVNENLADLPFASDYWLQKLRICEEKNSVPIPMKTLPVVSNHHLYAVCLFKGYQIMNPDKTFNLKELSDLVRISFGKAPEYVRILTAFQNCAKTVTVEAGVNKKLDLSYGLYECLRGKKDIRHLVGLSA